MNHHIESNYTEHINKSGRQRIERIELLQKASSKAIKSVKNWKILEGGRNILSKRKTILSGQEEQNTHWRILKGTDILLELGWEGRLCRGKVEMSEKRTESVSYTHLTLPTIVEWCRSRWSPYH